MRPIFVIAFITAFAAFLPASAPATEASEEAAENGEMNPEAAADTAAETLNEAEGATEEDALPDPDAELLFLDAREIDVREFIWNRRIAVVMADTPNDPAFERQLASLRDRADEFVDRDLVVIFDAHPEDNSALRQVMRARGFMIAIIDKDGEVKARRPAPRSGRELMAVIDRFPLRRQEMLERNPAGR